MMGGTYVVVEEGRALKEDGGVVAELLLVDHSAIVVVVCAIVDVPVIIDVLDCVV